MSCWNGEASVRKLTIKLLHITEALFLYAHGWTRLEGDFWQRPTWYEPGRNNGEAYRTGHVVNSQKWTNAHEYRRRAA